MHILQVAPYYPPYPGGQERYVRSLSRALVDAGHSVSVLTSDYPEDHPRRFEENGIRVFRFRTLIRLFRNPFTPGMLFLPREIGAFDLIHAHNEHGFSSDIAVLLKKISGRPMVLTSHGNLVYGSWLPDAACTLYEKTFGRWIFRQTDRITVATPSEKARIIREDGIPAEKITVIPVGIDLRYWRSFASDAKLPAGLAQVDPQTKVILVATQLIRRKGIAYLIRAIPEILLRFPDIRVALAGSGDAEAELRRLAAEMHLEDKVLFLGRLFEAELTAVYERSDVFVLPSIAEGQPTCILEAWMHAKPVVATDIPGVSDYYRDAAILAPCGDSHALAEAVVDLLEHPRLAEELGGRGKRLVESTFDWRVLVKPMLDAYASAMEFKA